ncbi:hypothetical protein L1887_57901 [Cichorium endivia]|nr:hypothetical protein L1887_57901 [Cichorium endivia]
MHLPPRPRHPPRRTQSRELHARLASRTVLALAPPVKRRRMSPEQTPIANGSPSRPRRPVTNAPRTSQTNGTRALGTDDELSDGDGDEEEPLNAEQDDAPSAACRLGTRRRRRSSPTSLSRRLPAWRHPPHRALQLSHLRLASPVPLRSRLGGAPAPARSRLAARLVRQARRDARLDRDRAAKPRPATPTPIIKRTPHHRQQQERLVPQPPRLHQKRRARGGGRVQHRRGQPVLLPAPGQGARVCQNDRRQAASSRPEKAVGGERLVRWHAKLNAHGKQAAEIANKLKERQDEKAHLEQRNQALQVDVQRFEERKQIQERIERLEVMLAMADYKPHQAQRTRAPAGARCASPAARRNRAARPARASETHRARRKDDQAQPRAGAPRERVRQRRQEAAQPGQDGRGARRRDRDQAHRGGQCSTARTRTARGASPSCARRSPSAPRVWATSRGAQDTAEVEAAMRAVRAQQDDCSTRCNDMQRQLQDVRVESQTIDRGMQNYREQLAQLDNVPQQRLEKIRSADEHVYRATMWLRENQHRFRKRVHEPVLLEIALKDQRYAAAVESCIPWVVQKSFVCQTREDYDTFTRELIDTQRAAHHGRRSGGHCARQHAARCAARAACGPGLRVVRDRPDRRARGRAGASVPTVAFAQDADYAQSQRRRGAHRALWQVPTLHCGRRELYDQRLALRCGRAPDRVAPHWACAQPGGCGGPRAPTYAVDQDPGAERQEEAARGHHAHRCSRGDQALKAEKARYDERLDELQRERRDKVGAQKQWQRERALIEARRRELRDKEREPSREEKRARLMKEVRALAQRRAHKGAGPWDACGVLIDNALRDVHEAEREAAAALEAAQAAHVRARREAADLRAHVQRLIDEAGDLVAGLDPNDDELLDTDRCSAELRAEQSKLDLAEGVRPEVIEQYPCSAARNRLAVRRARGVGGASDANDGADCIHPRQVGAAASSAGGSGVSRVLASLVRRLPLVDEINQGMDPTAERVTHNHIVALTCQPHASQYFLITPKLLPDLAVHRRQKVLLVNNGVYAQKRFKLGPILEAKRRAQRRDWAMQNHHGAKNERVLSRVAKVKGQEQLDAATGVWIQRLTID